MKRMCTQRPSSICASDANDERKLRKQVRNERHEHKYMQERNKLTQG